MITMLKTLVNIGADTVATGEAKGADGNRDGESFLNLLSTALPGKAELKDGNALPLGAALSRVEAADTARVDTKDSAAALSEWLSTPGQTEALSTLLTSVGKTDAGDMPKSVDKDTPRDKPLNEAELQTLSALLTMLPQPVNTAQPAALAMTGTNTETAALPTLTKTGNAIGKSTADSLLPAESNAKKAAPTAPASGDSKIAAVAASTAQQPVDSKAERASNTGGDSRDNAALPVNNTAPITPQMTPAASSVTTAMPTTTYIAPPAAPTIGAQLGSQEWQQQISQNVTLFTRQGQHNAELRLHPEDLGQVQINLKLEDNQAQLEMMSPHSHVRAALEAALPTLRTALAESGIQLGQSNISSESFAQQQSGQQPQSHSARSGERFSLSGNDAETLPVAESLQRLASSNGAVDIFA